MGLDKKSFSAGLPHKTAWVAVWFVVFGVLAYWTFAYLFPDGDSEAMAMTGPVPGASRSKDVPKELDEDVLVVVDHISVAKKKRPPRKAHQPIDDPGGSMCRFYQALDDLDTKSDGVVHVLHFGDSILTNDELSGKIRRVLQKRFGDAGHGFVLLGKPWRWYHHQNVRHNARGDWTNRPITSAPIRDGLAGLGGVAFETRGRATAWAATAEDGEIGTQVASFDISYLQQPRGGSFDVVVDDRVIKTVSTEAEKKQVAHEIVKVKPGRAKLATKTKGDGPIRLFGVVLENDQPGVVYDSLAINGARAVTLDRIDPEHWKRELKRREPNLVVFMLGANEAHNESLVVHEYKKQLTRILAVIKEGTPDASCLVVGPLDQAEKKTTGRLGSRKMPIKLTAAQKEVAVNSGCAFFDSFTAMGGKRSMARWYRDGLGGGDLIHPTEEGSRIIGSWIVEALLSGYEHFVYGDKQCVQKLTSL